MRLKLVLAAAVMALGVPAGGQTPALDDEEITRTQHAFDRLRAGAYLEAMNLLEAAPEDARERSLYTQLRPALDGFVVLTEARRRPPPPADPEQLARYDGAAAREAIAEIVERARLTRVVIVNETHDNPRDRAFVLAVAEALRPLGFSVYAAETFSNWPDTERPSPPMELLAADGVPRRDTGFYSAEPMFGYLIRRVLALDYRPLAYEIATGADRSDLSMAERVVERETAQAENLARAIAADPEARFLVHVGYSHATELPMPGIDGSGPIEWMAARLAQMTGIDPLTVDQADFSEFDALGALYAALAPRVGSGAKIFLKDGEPVRLGMIGRATDLQVVHPPITVLNGRPDWLAVTGRQAVSIPPELLPAAGRRLVQAFAADDPDDAIPIDQALASAGEEPPVIYVPAGLAIRWAVQDD